MKKIVVLLFACLLVFCGCSGAEAEDVCTVTFDSQGGSAVETQVVVFAGKAVEPIPPTKECQCEFDGWYLGDERWSFIGYSVTEDITLTARWIECFDLNEKEIEIIKGCVESRDQTWQDIDNIQKEYLADCDLYEYKITFKDGSEFFGNAYIGSDFVD